MDSALHEVAIILQALIKTDFPYSSKFWFLKPSSKLFLYIVTFDHYYIFILLI